MFLGTTTKPEVIYYNYVIFVYVTGYFCLQEGHITALSSLYGFILICACVHAYFVCVRFVRACVRSCNRACVRACVNEIEYLGNFL